MNENVGCCLSFLSGTKVYFPEGGHFETCMFVIFFLHFTSLYIPFYIYIFGELHLRGFPNIQRCMIRRRYVTSHGFILETQMPYIRTQLMLTAKQETSNYMNIEGTRYKPGHMRKLPVTWGGVFHWLLWFPLPVTTLP